MSLVSLQNSSEQEVTILSNRFIDNFMPRANGEFVKVYIYLLRMVSAAPSSFSLERMADCLFCTERDISRALKYWESEKLVSLTYTANQQLSGITLLEPFADAGHMESSASMEAGTTAAQTTPAAVSGNTDTTIPESSDYIRSLTPDRIKELKQKEETVKKLLGRFGPVEHIRGMETPYHYRNKVISTFTTGWGGKLTSGIYAANSHKVLPVESCLLQDEVLDKTMLAVRAAAGICHYQPFNEDKGTGLLRHCLLRRGVMTGQVMVVLVTAQPVLPGAKNFVKALLTEAGKQGVAITTIVQNVNDRKTSVVLGDMEKVLYGKGFILDTLCGKTYAISPRSFYQVNPAQTAVLYGLAVEAAKLTGKEVVLDAYCGIGTIGLTAADHAKQVVGVELNRDAVQDAIGNARHNGVKNARFFAADATRWIREAAAAGEKADVIFMDPPREGSTPEFLASVARMAPKRVVYVSCNPVTLARDLATLTKLGYKAEGFTPVDMFPHTEHIETVCALSKLEIHRKKPSGKR